MTLPEEAELTNSFEQQIAVKIHSNLVLRKSLPLATGAAASPTKGSIKETAQPPLLRVRVASALAKTDLGLSLPSALVDDDVIVTGKKHKTQILQEYEEEFGAAYPKSIITRRKGKHSCEPDILHPTRMLPSTKKYYRVQELTLYYVITTAIEEYRDCFNSTDLHNLSRINRDFSKMVPNTILWLRLDFSPLCKPQYNHESQATISSR
jgi:hypothetical protein